MTTPEVAAGETPTVHVAPELRCSAQWLRDDLPAWGTASRAAFWVALEQSGPWGNKALTQSHLDPQLGELLENTCSEAGGRAVLIRRPGRHVDISDASRTLLVAGGLAGPRPWLGRTTIGDPGDALALLQLGEDLAHGPLPEWLTPTEPVLAVCTNAKRDQCCALSGRGLIHDLGPDLAPRIWEVTHLGGHRFAPTALVLPSGQTLGRLTPDLARQALAAADAGRLVDAGPLHDRGRSHLEPLQQVIDVWARGRGLDIDLAHAPVSPLGGDQWLVQAGGHLVRVARQTGDDELPSSCGASLVPVARWTLEEEDHG
ncbi:sucrase ferredoxin [Propionibacteriaceae bacterium G1746]|uniref:sucrase ferredoxin n=1 Tax=Aestuariimicrobium sp. G57 TaxID=3418485 RepID=UPI003C1DADC6